MPDETELDNRAYVLAAVQQAGISPTQDEISMLVASYAEQRLAVAALYAVPGVRYEDPAIEFDPRLGTP